MKPPCSGCVLCCRSVEGTLRRKHRSQTHKIIYFLTAQQTLAQSWGWTFLFFPLEIIEKLLNLHTEVLEDAEGLLLSCERSLNQNQSKRSVSRNSSLYRVHWKTPPALFLSVVLDHLMKAYGHTISFATQGWELAKHLWKSHGNKSRRPGSSRDRGLLQLS